MNPQTSDHIKVYFRNGLLLEGVVISWTNKVAVLKSLASENKIIIQNIEQDVQAVAVMSSKHKPRQVFIDEPLELEEPERNEVLRFKKLAELRILRSREEKELAREALTRHDISKASTSQAQYGLPRRLQQPPIDFDSDKEVRTPRPRNNR